MLKGACWLVLYIAQADWSITEFMVQIWENGSLNIRHQASISLWHCEPPWILTCDQAFIFLFTCVSSSNHWIDDHWCQHHRTSLNKRRTANICMGANRCFTWRLTVKALIADNSGTDRPSIKWIVCERHHESPLIQAKWQRSIVVQISLWFVRRLHRNISLFHFGGFHSNKLCSGRTSEEDKD